MKLRRAVAEDALVVLEWRNDPVAVAFSKSGAVDPASHIAWFAGAVLDPNRDVLIAEEDGRRVGMIRFDHDERGATVSIVVSPAERGFGYGTQMLASAMRRGVRYLAEIDTDNAVSLSLFERCGFEHLGEVGGYVEMEFVP